MSPMLDDDFLKELFENRQRTTMVRIVALDYDENPIEEISGRVTSGSINIDGTSAVRRTCSLSLVAAEMDINNYYWGLNTKIKIYIGLENNINSKYDKMIWFKAGTFVITTFNTTQNLNSYTISLQGKDKMSLLNGDLGGSLTALTYNFGTIISYLYSNYEPVEVKKVKYSKNKYWVKDDEGNYSISKEEFQDGIQYYLPDESSLYSVKEKIKLKDIIRESVHTFGKEPYRNIVINDLDDYGLELMEYRGDIPIYFLINCDTDEVEMMVRDGNSIYYYADTNTPVKISEIDKYDQRISDFNLVEIDAGSVIKVTKNDTSRYTVAKIEYGETCGYRLTELTYTDDLTVGVGTSVTAGVLDKIKNMLGNFEYFYDEDGRFIFQEKKNYVNTSWNTIMKDSSAEHFVKIDLTTSIPQNNLIYYTKDAQGNYSLAKDGSAPGTYYMIREGVESEQIYVENSMESASYSYYFGNGNLVTSFQNQPNLANLRNDFSIWGTKTGVSGTDVPVHLRYAIDKKPQYYKNFNGDVYTTLTEEEFNLNRRIENLTISSSSIKNESQFGLSEDWWEVRDWANAWLANGLEVPTKNLGTYCKTSAVLTTDFSLDGTTSDINPYAVLFRESVYTYVNADDLISWQDSHCKDDFFIGDDLVFNEDGKLITAHICCSHSYTWWLNQFEPGGMYEGGYAYFFRPEVPEEDIPDGGFVFEIEDTKDFHFGVDWREIIYQMALDYNTYHLLDNFEATIISNNSNYYPTGITGYENYYIDIEGFWRQLYDNTINPIDFSKPIIPNSIYYKWNEETEDFTKVDFLDCVKTKNISPSGVYYYEDSNSEDGFSSFYNYSNSSVLYDAPTKKYLTNLNIDGKYYYLNGNNYVENTSTINDYVVYDGSFNKELSYYTYNSNTNSFVKEDGLEKFVPNVDYYIYRSIPTFAPGRVYYEYKGVVRTTSFTKGYSYYDSETKDRLLFTILSDATYYYLLDEGKYAKTDNFSIGQKYYTYNGTNYVEAFTIPAYSAIFKDFGYSKALDLSEYNTTSCIYYLDRIGNINFTTIFLSNHAMYVAKLATNIQNNKTYYIKSSNKLSPVRVLKDALPFDINLYQKEGSEYKLINQYEWKDTSLKLYDTNEYNLNTHWNYMVTTNPSQLNFWFDFLDTEGELSQYSVSTIGDRPKAVNDSNAKSIYYRETPSVIFINSKDWADAEQRHVKTGYTYVNIPEEFENLFSVSSKGKTCMTVLDDYLYNYSYCTEQITMSTIPIYTLRPNTRIYVRDDSSHIDGEYLITRLTIPLAYNGTMSITATKAPASIK